MKQRLKTWLGAMGRLWLLGGGLALLLAVIGTVFDIPETTMTIVAAISGIILGLVVAIVDIVRGRV
jgi:tetrahydromethanopterin S-methyltransferase subunit C